MMGISLRTAITRVVDTFVTYDTAAVLQPARPEIELAYHTPSVIDNPGNPGNLGHMADAQTRTDQVVTTGEAATILKCSLQTVIRLIETGRLHGWKIPGSTHRRMFMSEVLRYARTNGIPVEGDGE